MWSLCWSWVCEQLGHAVRKYASPSWYKQCTAVHGGFWVHKLYEQDRVRNEEAVARGKGQLL